MRSSANNRFWKCYNTLPSEIRKQAKEAYMLFKKNPYHPGLRFKQIHSNRPIYSVRINIDYRAIGIISTNENEITRFWIGSHSNYDNVVKQLRNE